MQWIAGEGGWGGGGVRTYRFYVPEPSNLISDQTADVDTLFQTRWNERAYENTVVAT